MLTIPLTLLRFIHKTYRSKKIGYLLLIFCAQWIGQSPPIQAADTSRAALVLLGHTDSGKNRTAAALLRAKLTWTLDDWGDYFEFIILDNEQYDIEKKFKKPLLQLDYKYFSISKKNEKHILYDHKDLAYPFYNMRGFGKSGFWNSLQGNRNTEEAHESLKKVLKKPIKGFVLHVDHNHIKRRKNSTSLNVMDFLLPYFKDAKTIKQDLAPSVCLVITGVYKRGNTEEKKDEIRYSLRQSVLTCYTAFYQAQKTKDYKHYAKLAKQKAFYDIFLENPEQIKPYEGSKFDIDDFKLKNDKIVFFDPRDLVPYYHTQVVDTTPLLKVVEKFKGISPKAFVSNQKSKLLYLLPVAGAAAGLGYGTYQGYKKKNTKKPTKTSKPTAKQDKLAKPDKKKKTKT